MNSTSENATLNSTEEVEENLSLELDLDQANLIKALRALTDAGVDFKIKRVGTPKAAAEPAYVPFWYPQYQWPQVPQYWWTPSSVPSDSTSYPFTSSGVWKTTYPASTFGTDFTQSLTGIKGTADTDGYGDVPKATKKDLETMLRLSFDEDDLYGTSLPVAEVEELIHQLQDRRELESLGLTNPNECEAIMKKRAESRRGGKAR